MSRTRGAARQADSFGADTFKSTPVVYPGSSGTSTPSTMSTNIASSSIVPVGVRDPLISSRYAEVQDLNPNQITTVGDSSSNLGWTMVRTDRPVVLWPIKSRVATSSEVTALAISSAGSGYGITNTLTLAGGTGTGATATVASGRVTAVSSIAAAGSNYQLGDLVTFSGFTGSAPTARITTVAIQTLTIVSGGTGYTNGSTVTMVGGTGSALQATVTAPSGVVTGLTITIYGAYTALPSQTTTFTGGGGSGLTVNHSNYSVQALTLVNGGPVTSPNAISNPYSFTGSQGGTGGTANLAGYSVASVTLATGGSYSVLPASPNSATGGTGTGVALSITSYGGTSATTTTFNTGSPRVIFYAPNRIPSSTDYTQRSKGSGVVYLPNPGTWYLQHARDNTAEAITTEYIVIDAQDPAVIARYLAESGCHRVRTTQVSLTSSGARFALIGENRNRTGLLISVGTAALGATASLGLNFGGTATATNTNVTITPSSANWYTTGEQVWKGSVDGWFSGSTAPQTAYVTEWE